MSLLVLRLNSREFLKYQMMKHDNLITPKFVLIMTLLPFIVLDVLLFAYIDDSADTILKWFLLGTIVAILITAFIINKTIWNK